MSRDGWEGIDHDQRRRDADLRIAAEKRDKGLIEESWARALRELSTLVPSLVGKLPTTEALGGALDAIDRWWDGEAERWTAVGMERWKGAQQHVNLRSDFLDELPWAQELHRLGDQRYYDQEIPRVRRCWTPGLSTCRLAGRRGHG